MENSYLNWLQEEIQNAEDEIKLRCKNLQDNTLETTINTNTPEIIRVAQTKLNILNKSKEMYKIHHNKINL